MSTLSARTAKKQTNQLADLYEADETAWLEQMSQFIKKGQYQMLDYQNLAEYLLDMSKSDKRQVKSRLTRLMAHLLKSEHQPGKRSRSWASTIITQRHELEDLLESQTLMNYAQECLNKAYAHARREAAVETGLKEDKFPKQCPYTMEELMSDQ